MAKSRHWRKVDKAGKGHSNSEFNDKLTVGKVLPLVAMDCGVVDEDINAVEIEVFEEIFMVLNALINV